MEKSEMKQFGQRIINLRKEYGESQESLLETLGVTQQTLSRYEKGERQASLDFVIKAAKHYNVTADYLLGLSDCKSAEQDMQIACKVTGLSDLSIYKIQDIVKYPYFDIINNVLEDVEDSYQFSEILKKIFTLCENEIKIQAFADAFCELANVKFSLSDDSTNSIVFRNALIQLQAALNSFYSDTSDSDAVYKKAALFHLPLEEYEIGYNKFLLQSDIMNLIDSITTEYKFYHKGINGKTIEDIKQMYILELQKVPGVFQKYANALQQKQKESSENINNFFNVLFGKNNHFPNF